MKKIIFGIIILTVLIASAVIYTQRNRSQKITFAECEKMGGVAWQVDLFHPDICSSCAEYRKCEIEYNDYSDVCPECYAACPECQSSYSLHESCPDCYGSCQACQNKYLNDFENEEERHRLCPDCKKCDMCREELNVDIANCPPCISCNECKEENKKCSDIEIVCPQILQCVECMEGNGTYPDKLSEWEKENRRDFRRSNLVSVLPVICHIHCFASPGFKAVRSGPIVLDYLRRIVNHLPGCVDLLTTPAG